MPEARRDRCSVCLAEFLVKADGTIRYHGPHPKPCPGGGKPPAVMYDPLGPLKNSPRRSAMAEYPPTAAERAALRANLRTRLLTAAERAAAVAGFSLNCERRVELGTHPDGAPGCANDGTGCLCACHDRSGDDRG